MNDTKAMTLRMPEDWVVKADRIARARRQTRTAVIYDAVEKAWLSFLHEEAERKKLEGERGEHEEKKPWAREQLCLDFKDRA